MIFLLILSTVFSTVTPKVGPFFAEPNFIINHANDYPDIIESYFYLQQTSKWTVRFNAELHIKKRFGPMMGQLDILAWTGRSFKKPSGGPSNDLSKNICNIPGILYYLRTLEPKTGLDEVTCSLAPGNYSNSLNYDEHLHAANDVFPHEPIRVVLNINSNNKTYFGFTLQVDFYDLELYKYIPKN